MSELPPDVLKVLEAARSADEPSDADFRRVRRALTATLAASTVLTAAGAAKAAAPAGLGTSAGVALKGIGIALAVATAGGFAAWQFSRGSEQLAAPSTTVAAREPSQDRAAPSIPEPAVRDTASPAADGELVSGVKAANPASGPPLPSRAQARSSEDSAPSGAAAAPSRKTLAPPNGRTASLAASNVSGAVRSGETRSESVARRPDPEEKPTSGASEPPEVPEKPQDSEVMLMRRASQALSNGAPSDALQALEQHAALYPRGALAQERRALRIIALCQLGQRAAARQARERFLSEAPRSPLAAQIRRACGTSEAD
jgi:hypothetical protein